MLIWCYNNILINIYILLLQSLCCCWTTCFLHSTDYFSKHDNKKILHQIHFYFYISINISYIYSYFGLYFNKDFQRMGSYWLLSCKSQGTVCLWAHTVSHATDHRPVTDSRCVGIAGRCIVRGQTGQKQTAGERRWKIKKEFQFIRNPSISYISHILFSFLSNSHKMWEYFTFGLKRRCGCLFVGVMPYVTTTECAHHNSTELHWLQTSTYKTSTIQTPADITKC